MRAAIIIGIARNIPCEGGVRAARVSGCKVYGIVKACAGRGQYRKAHYIGGNSRVLEHPAGGRAVSRTQ
jgi:hypothetical protein